MIRFFATILLAVMVLNIGKYQLPYVEYYLFKDYIAENLCIKKDEVNNCCQGKCHLEKQVKQVNETESNPNSPVEKNRSNNLRIDDYIVPKIIAQPSDSFIEIRLPAFTDARIATINISVLTPPPKSFA